MQIDKNYSLVVDRTGVTLQYREPSTDANGKSIVRKADTYHPNIELALKAYLRKTLQSSEPTTLVECLKILENADKKIEEFLSTLKPSRPQKEDIPEPEN